MGYDTEIVSGITSFCAVAARLNIGLVEKHEELHVIPASYQIEEALQLPGTKVLMKSGRQMPAVLEALASKGALGKSALVRNCGLPGEAVCPDLSKAVPGEDSMGYFATVIVKE